MEESSDSTNTTSNFGATSFTFGPTYWKQQRNQILNCNKTNNDDIESNNQPLPLSVQFVALTKLITRYILFLTNSVDNDDIDDNNNNNSNNDNDNNNDEGKELGDNEDKDSEEELTVEQKSLILECRHALRYMLTLLSQQELKVQEQLQEHERVVVVNRPRSSIQEEAVCKYKLHLLLSALLSLSKSTSTSTSTSRLCDSKCQTMASKILCNLGTCNKKTSLLILKEIAPSPTTATHDNKNNTQQSSLDSASSWGDMIYATATTTATGKREALAAIAASMHNFIHAIYDDNETDNDGGESNINDNGNQKNHTTSTPYDLNSIATDSILMCNLVRFILPKDAIAIGLAANRANITTDYADGSTPGTTAGISTNKQEDNDMSDDATLWISLLLETLCSHGMFPQIYNSLGFNNNNNNNNHDNESNNDNAHRRTKKGITPEQVVLLNCLGDSVETYAQDLTTSSMIHSYKKKNPLGTGCDRGDSQGYDEERELEGGMETTIYFIAAIWLDLRRQIIQNDSLSQSNNTSGREKEEERYHGEIACMVYASKIILDILGTALSYCDGEDNCDNSSHNGNKSNNGRADQHSGDNSNEGDTNIPNDKDQNCYNRYYSSIRLQLGHNMKIPLLTNSILELGSIIDKLTITNRGLKARELVISTNDQHLIVGLVRLIGNLCYRCRANQDLVRQTNVPVPSAPISDPIVILGDENNDESADKNNQVRNGLHVMLSCTTFAYGCFTLREWGIVAIRNVLDKNDANQKEVALLEAQQVINTPEMTKLGIKVNLDDKGKVHVVPQEPS